MGQPFFNGGQDDVQSNKPSRQMKVKFFRKPPEHVLLYGCCIRENSPSFHLHANFSPLWELTPFPKTEKKTLH